MKRPARRCLIVAWALALWVGLGAVVASPAARADGAYVALGDSVATPSDSYVYRLFEFLRSSEGGGLDTLYNRARGGEDSTTLRTGGQLATAIADIDGPSDTKAVTIDIGGNDRFACGSPPSWHLPSCPFAANFDATLADLQAALGRDPGRESLVAMAYYNPASGTGTAQEQDYDRGLLGTDLRLDCAPAGDPRLGLDDQISCISRARGGLVADVYPDFKLGGQALMGDSVHPNSRGQAVIADEFRKALGKPPHPATAGEDWLIGTPGDDLLCGLAGSDVIFGLAGNDTLFGDACGVRANSDHLAMAAVSGGNDRLHGGTGNDRLYGARGADRLFGEAGIDSLVGGSGNDSLSGGDGKDRLDGGSGDDRLTGGSGNDRLTGGSGNDRLTGGKGKDQLLGGSGNDSINSRDGNRDTVDCGQGRKDKANADKRDRVRHCERVRR